MLVLLATLSIGLHACGGDDNGGDGNNTPRPIATIPNDEFFAKFEEIHQEYEAEVGRIDSELHGEERLRQGADAFDGLADEVDALDPSLQTAVIDQALAMTAGLLADELRALADSGETTSDNLESLLQDYEYVCKNFIDVSRATLGEEADLDCRLGYKFIE